MNSLLTTGILPVPHLAGYLSPVCEKPRWERPGTRSAIASARRRARGSTGGPDTVDHDLEVFPDPAGVAARAAGYVAGLARAAVAAGSRFSFAVSGGQTPWAMFRALAAEDMPWTS